MNILNLLSTEYLPFGVESLPANIGGLANMVKWLFDLFNGFPGAVVVGVIVFTLVLKTIVLPLETYSRIKTKKQSLLMEKMRPQMEKLQKQYANDKNMYSQKVMELQKANGYNPLSACLPTILSLIIFMIVFSAFNTYANYATLTSYNHMVDAYNESVSTYVLTDDVENPTDNKYFLVEGEGEYAGNYSVNYDKFQAYYATYKSQDEKIAEKMTKCDSSAVVSAFVKSGKFGDISESDKNEIVAAFVRCNARQAVRKFYLNDPDGRASTKFIWIGNVWYPDSMFNKEIPDFSKFSSSVSRVVSGIGSYKDSYNEVTADLGTFKNTHNGYFILIAVAIGLMFLQQFIMTRSQKAANELSSVDGSAARTNKMMMILMPLFYAFFSFFYSAAFSTYMITNTLYGLVTTLITNKLVSVSFAKKEINNELNKGKSVPKRKRLK